MLIERMAAPRMGGKKQQMDRPLLYDKPATLPHWLSFLPGRHRHAIFRLAICTKSAMAQHVEKNDIAELLQGLATRLKLGGLFRWRNRLTVQAGFCLIGGFISMASIAALAALTKLPFMFPSLGPTAFMLLHRPLTPSASPRNTISGHLIGVLAGYASLCVFDLTVAGPGINDVTWPRVGAAGLSLGLTAAAMLLLNVPHPPAGATTLIVALGILTSPAELAVLMGGVVLLVLEAFAINRLARIRYPLWKPN